MSDDDKKLQLTDFSFSTWQEAVGSGDQGGIFLLLDYYQRPFFLFHEDLRRTGYESAAPHPIRKRFWSLLQYREYEPYEIRPFLQTYIRSVEHRLKQVISRQSLTYWLHIYRRLSPHSVGLDTQPMTAGLTRAAMEAAIQKYSGFQPCDRVGVSGQVSVESVFQGLLMHSDFDMERKALKKSKEVVLTDFGTTELREFYDAERLSYELWRSMAMLRIVAKGAPVVVDDSPEYVVDNRSTELAQLIENFDKRWQRWQNLAVSAPGVIFAETGLGKEPEGTVFLPTYNVGGVLTDELEGYFEGLFNLKFAASMLPNFLWVPFNLKEFLAAHSPFGEAFEDKHNVPLEAVLALVSALCQRVAYIWRESKGVALPRYWQRGYEGPYAREHIIRELGEFLPIARDQLGLRPDRVSEKEFKAAFQFWELGAGKRSQIDLAYPGPHMIFLPYGKKRVFLDYAWIYRRLYDLFLGVSIPDQNFKGAALESIVRFKTSVLPVGPCISEEGERKQIDAAFVLEGRLVIVECKVVAHSIGFDRGQPRAIRYRAERLEQALEQVDEKAEWLANNPKGRNYEILNMTDILPIVVTPFVEYIPSRDSRYWLTDEVPRIISPAELRTYLEDGSLAMMQSNVVVIDSS